MLNYEVTLMSLICWIMNWCWYNLCWINMNDLSWYSRFYQLTTASEIIYSYSCLLNMGSSNRLNRIPNRYSTILNVQVYLTVCYAYFSFVMKTVIFEKIIKKLQQNRILLGFFLKRVSYLESSSSVHVLYTILSGK